MGNQNDKTQQIPVVKEGRHRDPQNRARKHGQSASPEFIDPKTGKPYTPKR